MFRKLYIIENDTLANHGVKQSWEIINAVCTSHAGRYVTSRQNLHGCGWLFQREVDAKKAKKELEALE